MNLTRPKGQEHFDIRDSADRVVGRMAHEADGEYHWRIGDLTGQSRRWDHMVEQIRAALVVGKKGRKR